MAQMRPLTRLLFLLKLLIITMSLQANDDESSNLNIIYIGDSLTAQVGYPEVCTETLSNSGYRPNAVNRFAEGGATPVQLLNRFKDETWLLPDPTEHSWAFVMAGTNAYNLADVLSLRSYLQHAGWQVVLITPPPRQKTKQSKEYDLPQANKAFNDQLRTWSNENPSHLLIDIVQSLKSLQTQNVPGEYLHSDYARDHTHLNDKGYTILGSEAAKQFKVILGNQLR